MSGPATVIAAGAQFVTLGIDSELFAVEVETVREILEWRPVSRLPHAPPYLLGMIDVRGHGVPVIDLRVKLGLAPVPPTEYTRILVLETVVADRPLMLALMADRVLEVTALDRSEVEHPPEIGVRWRSDYIRGVGRRGAAFVIIIDLARLFSSDEVPFLVSGAPPPVARAPALERTDA